MGVQDRYKVYREIPATWGKREVPAISRDFS